MAATSSLSRQQSRVSFAVARDRILGMSTPAERALARGQWPSAKTTLQEASESLVELSGQAAWDAVMELTWEAFSLAGGVPPRLPRSQWPSSLYRPGEKRPEE